MMLNNLRKKLKLANKYYLKSCYYDSPVQQNDFPQHFIPVDLEEYTSKIKAFKQFAVQAIEKVEYGKHRCEILSISYEGTRAFKKLLVFAGVHGNETGGVLAIPGLLSQIEESPAFYRQWSIRIITPVNPIGVLYQSRHNENGCDLNRRFFDSREKGVIVQRKMIDEFQPDMIISLHEAPSIGFLIHPNEQVSDNMVAELLAEVEAKGVQLSEVDYWGRPMKTKGCSRVTGIMKLLAKLIKVEALEDYVSDRKIPVITTESGWAALEMDQRIDSHVHLINSVIRYPRKNSL